METRVKIGKYNCKKKNNPGNNIPKYRKRECIARLNDINASCWVELDGFITTNKKMNLRIVTLVLLLTYSHYPPLYSSYDDFPITPLYRNEWINADYIYSFNPSCPYAKKVEIPMVMYVNLHQHKDWYFTPPSSMFPSPTLRIRNGEGYQNYIGINQIKNAINMRN
jgi:hypothetical protein